MPRSMLDEILAALRTAEASSVADSETAPDRQQSDLMTAGATQHSTADDYRNRAERAEAECAELRAENERLHRLAKANNDYVRLLAARRQEICEALARHDDKLEQCPIDRPRCVSKPPEICPRCRAKSNEVCFVKNDADYRFVSEVRAALKGRTDG